MAEKDIPHDLAIRILYGFVAGFIATLVFHQLAFAVMWMTGLVHFAPYSMKATHPFGVPAVISLAFWGGIWGITYSVIERGFPGGTIHWITAFLFGAVLPSACALLIVFPLRGLPMGGGWHLPLLAMVFVLNGIWGIGTALNLKALSIILDKGHTPHLGLDNNRLKKCPKSPNCVSSQENDPVHAIAPLIYQDGRKEAFARLRRVLTELKRTVIIMETKDYIHAEAASFLFRFVDDMEFYFPVSEKVIHVRSASRKGYSDLGVNRKRVEEIRRRFSEL